VPDTFEVFIAPFRNALDGFRRGIHRAVHDVLDLVGRHVADIAHQDAHILLKHIEVFAESAKPRLKVGTIVSIFTLADRRHVPSAFEVGLRGGNVRSVARVPVPFKPLPAAENGKTAPARSWPARFPAGMAW